MMRTVLDYVATPVVIVKRDGSVRHLNSAARTIIEREEALEIQSGALTSRDELETIRIQILVTQACSQRKEVARAGVVPILRGDDVLPLQLCVLPLGKRVNRGAHRLAAIFILDPEQKVTLDERFVQIVYGLSPAESRVTVELISGHDMHEIAQRLCVSIHTIRTHMKSIMSKTSTRTQKDLVRMLVVGAGSLHVPYW